MILSGIIGWIIALFVIVFYIFVLWLLLDIALIIAIGGDKLTEGKSAFLLWTIFLPVGLLGLIWETFKKHSN